MKELVSILSTYSILFAALIGLFKFKKIVKAFQPFFYFVWFASANEILNILCIDVWKNNAANSNVYVLIEFVTLLRLFYLWGQTKFSIKFYKIVVIFGILIWFSDNVIFHSITTFNSMFRILYSFLIVYLSIDELNFVILERNSKIYLNAQFILCLTFILYFTYKALFEVFFFVDIKMSDAFYIRLYFILVLINLFANLLYSVAALCIPTKQRFTLPYL